MATIAGFQIYDGRHSPLYYFVYMVDSGTGQATGLSKEETIELASLNAQLDGTEISDKDQLRLNNLELIPHIRMKLVLAWIILPILALWIVPTLTIRVLWWIREGFRKTDSGNRVAE